MSLSASPLPVPGGQLVPDDLARLAEAAITASRVLAGIDAEVLAELEVTASQYRVIATLGARGPMNVISLSEALDMGQSTVSRTTDRLVKKRLVTRRTSRIDRREVRLAISVGGAELLEEFPRRRRERVAAILSTVPGEHRDQLAASLALFAGAVGVAESGGESPKAC